ncbi:oxalate decarboxylase [Roridomyces roridus]|uniref:Oxalate decarboxylase n=1 Tax=Roridomyces roridus TaxID=1738132 RepID=A0AAD7CKM7_9AGAR|nr:oxalate decarboxylase [Roridomyces roridus]
MIPFFSCLCSLYLAACVAGAPAPSGVSSQSSVSPASSTLATASSVTASAAEPSATVPFASTEPNAPVWGLDSGTPQPIRGSLGASVLGPNNLPLDRMSPDMLAPPTTDAGNVNNAKWPFALSHNRLQTGGWARQENIGVMPIATSLAGVNMRQVPSDRELHWHSTSEWAYVLSGTTQVTAVNAEGQNFVANVGPGDLWFFPPGIPHSLQATNESADGSEFLLIFDDGAFSEDATFLLTDWLSHVPAEVLQKNFQASPDAFSHIPAKELYIFPGSPPPLDAVAPSSPQGTVDNPYSFALSKVNATQHSGGTVKIVDSTTFIISTTVAAAEVTVEPGAIRELHWHPTMDEWSFFLEGTARVTIFASQGNARTFDYQPGDIGFVPTAMGHYVENTGNTTLKYLEIFNTDRFQDISLNQWLALTPPELVKAHLQLSDETIASLSKTKPVVVGPN